MFLKNIEALKKINANLASKLVNLTFDKARETIDIAKSKSDDIIFIKNNMPLESIQNPVEEIFYNIQSNIKNQMEKFDFIVIYGLGVGYVLDYIFEKYSSRLAIVEPDLNVLRVAFELVDFTEYLDTGRVFITDIPEEIYDFISQKYIVNDKIEIIFLTQYISIYGEEIKDFSQKIYETCLMKISDVNTIKKNSELWVSASISYIKTCARAIPISILDNQFEGKMALIAGSGPSLKDNISNIKKYRDRFVIFAINRSIPFLVSQGVIPDFGIFTDTGFIKNTINENTPFLQEINFITDIKVDPYVYGLPKKRRYTYFPENYEFAKILSEKYPYIKLYETAGTSTFCALNTAKHLGFKDIILCGCDLAFKGNEPYCQNTDIVVTEKEVKIDSMVKKIVQVKSVTGNMVNTREDYAIFIKQFERFFTQNSNLNAFNVSSFGADIKGVKNIEFSQIMTQIEQIFDQKSIEEIICLARQKSDFNPIELKHIAKEIVQEDLRKIFELRADIKEILENDLKDKEFFLKTVQILDKISKTIFLAQLIQFELLSCTKIITMKDSVAKRAKLELFLEGTFKKVEILSKQLAEI